MNGNRMKYASTPTYGMQKRGFMKKPVSARPVSETPDFSKAPETAASMPFPPVFPQQPMQGQTSFAPQPPVYPSAPSFFPQTGAIPMQQSTPVPFAAPSFVPQTPPMPVMPQMQMPQQPAQQQLPLGNTVAPLQRNVSFSSRAQGFVPPKTPVQPAPNPQPAMPRTAAPFGTVPPFGGMNNTAAPFQQPNMGFAPQTPSYQQPVMQPVQPAMPQQPAFAPKPQSEKKPLDADRIWTVFLFGLLPLLFIPCLFVPGSWDVLRYVFMGLTVVGLGAMWYRQMYAPTTRLIVSVAYVALCVATIATLMQNSADIRQTVSRAPSVPAQQQQQHMPASENQQAVMPVQTPEPVVQPTPEPVVGPSEAERRLELFMSLWQMNNASEMVHLVQPSWCSRQENPSQELFKVLMNRTPEDFVIEEISGSDTDNSRTVTMRATISKNNNKAPVIYRFMVMMVKEGNEWYVNPNSLATNDEVQQTEENVVNNKNAVGNVTAPPRTTVTPAPPASTLLYYNDGANYYHMDPNCVSVKSEYLPFDFSFSYGELKTVMKQYGLSPCLKCNAPTSTLD